jgi:hypothetical protein|tara:strand:- start:277 stop:642 length:366 start_codon:yes stop_codon:yes gene_type:complete
MNHKTKQVGMVHLKGINDIAYAQYRASIPHTFTTTGFHKPTLTTFEDPSLKVLEQDNGNTWTISFYVGTELIDTINMEYLNLYVVHKDLLNLPVYESYDNTYVGRLGERICNEVTKQTLIE